MAQIRMVRLGDICKVVSGTTPKTENPDYWDGNLNWITPAEITDETVVICESQRKITQAGVKSCGLTPFPAGTVILSSRAPIGKTAIAGVDMYCNQGFKNLICSDLVFNKYLFWFLRSKTDYLNFLGRGATFKEISKKIVEEIEIPLVSMEQQQSVAAILDKVSAVIALRKRQLAKLDELVKARFVEMFGDPILNNKNWPMVTLGEIAELRIGPFGTLLHKEDYISGGHALVNPSHIINGTIRTDDNLTISDSKYEELSAYQLQIGDIVLGRRGEMGRCAVVRVEGLLCGTGSMIIRPNNQMKPYFLQNIISRPEYKEIIESKAVGITMMNLNVPIVSTLSVPLLPLDLQDNFTDYMSKIEKLRLTIRQGLDKMETLKRALMQEYFT